MKHDKKSAMDFTLNCYDGRREAWIMLNTDGTHLVQSGKLYGHEDGSSGSDSL